MYVVYHIVLQYSHFTGAHGRLWCLSSLPWPVPDPDSLEDIHYFQITVVNEYSQLEGYSNLLLAAF